MSGIRSLPTRSLVTLFPGTASLLSIMACFILLTTLMTTAAWSLNDDDFLAVLGPGGRMTQTNYSEYTPAFAEFLARDGQPSPVHLGRDFWMSPVQINYSTLNYSALNYSALNQSADDQRWLFSAEADGNYPWLQDDGDGLVIRAYQFPGMDGGYDEYHVPSIVEFLDPGYRPGGANYSRYVLALGEFADPGWQPARINFTGYVPALEEFAEEGWEPPEPTPDSYPQWMVDYLRD